MPLTDEELTLKLIKYNATVFDHIFGAFIKQTILPAGDGTCNTEQDKEDEPVK